MGFAKQEKRTSTEHFEPSTKEQIKDYSKRARKAERQHKKEKHRTKEEAHSKDKLSRLSGEALRTALTNRKPFKIYPGNLFGAFIEACTAFDIKKPRYYEYLEQREADAKFCFDIASALSRLPWQKLTDLVRAGTSTTNKPHGLATRSWSEALQFTEHVMHLALGAVEKKGTMRLTDLAVLDNWPVESRKRPTKEDKMLGIDEKNAAMKAKSRDNDDEDDDEEEEKGGKDKDVDKDEEDEDGDEDEGRASKKGKGFKKKKKSKDDEEDDADDDSDEDDEDADDEKPARKKGKGRKASKEEDNEESDESDDDDDSDEEEEKPRRKKRREKVKIEDKTTVSKIGDREKGGPKTKLLGMIPKKGITVKQLSAAAGEEGIKSSKVKNFLKSLHKYGYIKAA
jgi:hypothetical protein